MNRCAILIKEFMFTVIFLLINQYRTLRVDTFCSMYLLFSKGLFEFIVSNFFNLPVLNPFLLAIHEQIAT